MNGNVCNESRGFTLIELMIVLAIAAILMTIAIPAFNEQMAKSRRSKGVSAVQQIALLQEKWRASNATYTTSLANLGAAAVTDDGNYALSVPAANATGFRVLATAQGAQSGDRCGNIGYTFDGTQPSGREITLQPTTSGQSNCW